MNNKYNLTFPESNIYLVEKFNDGTAINTIAGSLKIETKFDEKIRNEIINKLIESNDSLRIKIYEEDNLAYQIVDDFFYKNVKYVDMSGKSHEEIQKYFENSVKVPFEFLGNNLHEFTIIRFDENTGYIFMKLHHIISDAWTLRQIINQLVKMYNDILNNVCEKNIVTSYVEFVESEKEYISSEKYIKDEEYWKEYLNGIQTPISLKTATSKVSTRANRYSVTLDKEVNDKITEYTKVNKVSPYTLFLGALATYIYRIKDKNDFVIGTPILNRANFREKQILGMFVSTMPIRMKIEEYISFLGLVKQIGCDTMSLFRHQKYPITKTLEHIHNTTDIDGKIYNIALSYQNARSDISASEVFSTNWIFSGCIQDDLEIHIMDMDNNGVLTLNYDYLADLFNDVEIEYLHTRIMSIIQNAIKDIDVNVDNISIMTKEEENKILYEFNDTDTDYPKDKTVIDIFEEEVEKTPDGIALVVDDKKFTYRELNEKANVLAFYLREEKKVQINDVIAVMLDKSFELIISILGILKSGAAYLPIDKNLPNDRINYMIQNSNCKIVVSDKKSNLDNVFLVEIDTILLNCKNQTNLSKVNTPNDLVYVMYTSGSTGNPKGAMMAHTNIIKLVKNIKYFNMDKIDNVFLAGNVVFDASMHEMWLCLLNGKTGYLISKDIMMNPIEYSKILTRVNNSLVIFTTQLFHQYAMFNSKMFEKVAYLVAGGDVMLSEYAKKVIDNSKNTILVNIYGPTECSAATTTQIVNSSNYTKITIGKPIDNTKCYIVDKKNRLCPIYVEGELYIAGKGVGLGYINNDEMTKKSFVDFNVNNQIEKVYKSGDICSWNYDGNINFQGRIDFQVKIRGYRIEISEIQNATLKLLDIKEAYVIARSIKNSKILNMYVTSDNIINIAELKKELHKKLPDYMVPSQILQIDKMPLNSIGKIDRNSLPEISLKSIKKIVMPENPTQQILLSIFTEVMSNKQINIDDDLFDLGLDSLQVANAIVLCNEKNLEVGYQDIYDCRNIKSLEESLTSSDNAEEDYSKYIDQYDYEKINKILDTDTKDDVSKNRNKRITDNILITGATGFLGSHLVENILLKHYSNIFCIVRTKNENGQKRIEDILTYYFGDNILKKYGNRIKVIDMDLLDSNSNIKLESTIKENNIKTIINCAANVKHYGNREDFKKLNIEIVNNIVNICKTCKIRLIHISTLSVSGNGFENSFVNQSLGEKRAFDEKSMYINQKITNIYSYTKYISELCVLEARADGLDASIMRVGNLMSRYKDGKFQKNIEDNGFAQRIKFILDNAILPENIYNDNYLEFSQVDLLSDAVMKLAAQKNMNPIYHLFNNNHLYINKFVKMILKIYKRKIEILDIKEFSVKLDEILKNDTLALYRVILSDLKGNDKLDYLTDIVVESKITNKRLKKLKFKWPKINSRYLKLFVESIYDRKDVKNIWKV